MSLVLGGLAIALAALAGLLLARLSVELGWLGTKKTLEPPPDRLQLRQVGFADLPGWTSDRLTGFVPALARSCLTVLAIPAAQPVGIDDLNLTAGAWRRLCDGVESLEASEDRGLRLLLEAELNAWEVSNRGDPSGFFTGYFEPTLNGSRQADARFRFPLYLRPPELVDVDLGRFRDDLRGRRIAGRLDGQSLVPYLDRAAIEGGGLAGRGLELLWVDSAIDAFFLHIQGSGRVELREGGSVRVGYASQNGHSYTAIGRALVERKELTLESVSMQTIRGWLAEHPDEAGPIMQSNASYVFFRELAEPGPVGSQGVLLTAERSLAVDRRFLPLGAPIWIDTTVPATGPDLVDSPLRRLMVAQDTGGAIRGPIRGDVFWGSGRRAGEIAGRMKQSGRMWLLLPKKWSPPAAAS